MATKSLEAIIRDGLTSRHSMDQEQLEQDASRVELVEEIGLPEVPKRRWSDEEKEAFERSKAEFINLDHDLDRGR